MENEILTGQQATWTLIKKMGESYWGKEVPLTYGMIFQRWLVVFSQAAYDRELHTLTKN